MDGKAPQVRHDPTPSQSLGHGPRCPAAAEEIGDKIAFVGGGGKNPFNYVFWFLRSVTKVFCLISWLEHPNPPYIINLALSAHICDGFTEFIFVIYDLPADEAVLQLLHRVFPRFGNLFKGVPRRSIFQVVDNSVSCPRVNTFGYPMKLVVVIPVNFVLEVFFPKYLIEQAS